MFRSQCDFRNWLRKHGKGHYIDFEDDKRKKLWEYFVSLDDDGSASIGANELEDPLIALGLVQDRQQVDEIIRKVDDDDTGEIEFQEFLKIISMGKRKPKAGEDDGKNKDGDDCIGAIVDW